MVLRDKGPVYNLGFGVTTSELNIDPDGSTIENPNPESGIVAKALHGNPVMRFLAVGAATLVGATVAGRLIRSGGIKVGAKVQDSLVARHGSDWVTNKTSSMRAFQRELDKLQGAHRTSASDRTDAGTLIDDLSGIENPLFRRNEAGQVVTDQLDDRAGWSMTREEKMAMGTNKRGAVAGEAYIDAIQKRMVRQARRLPYELPAAYVFDRALTDKIVSGEDRGPKEWSNPVDVLTNFVTESVKNVAFAFAPFEVGAATGSTAFKRFMAYGDDMANLNPNAIDTKTLKRTKQSVATKNILAKVGHDAAEVHNRAVRFSAQSTGAISNSIQEAQKSSKSIVDYLHNVRSVHAREKAMSPHLGPVERMKNALVNETLPDIGPGSLRGMGTGFKAGKKRFGEIGEAFNAYDELTRVGGRRFASEFSGRPTSATGRQYDEALQDYFNIRQKIGGATAYENLAYSMRDLGLGGPGEPGKWNQDWFDSTFYQSQMDTEYRRILRKDILSETGDEAFTDRLINEVRISNPGAGKDIAPLHQRVRFDRKKDVTGLEGREYIENVSTHLTQFNQGQRDFFQNNIKRIVDNVDDRFRSDFVNKSFQSNVNKRFNYFQKNIVPDLAENVVKPKRRGYQEFLGKVSEDNQRFLQRQAAKANGLQDADSADMLQVRSHLRNRGFKDPDDSAILRGYLADKGAISKPWQTDGFNLFGFRQLTVEEGRNRGILDPTYKRGDNKNPIVGRSISDEYNLIARGLQKKGMGIKDATLPGMYMSRGGRVVDTNVVSGAARKTLEFVSEQLQVPILNFNPLEALGFPALRNVRERGAFSYVEGYGRQPFLGGQADVADDMYIWARTKSKAKGGVFAVGKTPSGEITSRTLKGTYRPFSAEAENLVSYQARIAAGESGRARSPERGKRADAFFDKVVSRAGINPEGIARRARPSSLARTFDVADDQPQSIFGYASRFAKARRRGGDFARPSVTAQAIRSGPEGVNSEVISNVEGMLASVRRLGFGERTTSGLFGGDDPIRALGLNVSGQRLPNNLRNLVDSEGFLDVSGISTPDQLKDVLSIVRNQARSSQNRTISSAQKRLLSRFSSYSNESFLGQIRGRTQTETIFTRLDEAKQEIYRYLGVDSAARGEFDPSDIQARLAGLKSSGTITSNEYIESSAALLSIQAEVLRYANFAPGRNARDIAEDIATGLSTPQNRSLLDPVADNLIGIGNKRLTGARAFARSKLGSAQHEYSGTEYNPFGVDTVLVPTFGTVFDRDPRKAIASVLQWDNWKTDPTGANSSFSGASIPGAHLFERINRYAGALGLGLDPTGYRGGLDFYARGLVGKRALPIAAGGAGLLAADSTLGGLVNEKDDYGDRVYSPYFTTKAARGLVELQSVAAGVTPGGMTYGEKQEELLEGEVPIRAGRFWPLGNTPFEGGRVQYFRPSYYRRLESGYKYTDQSGFDSPMEKLAFGYDFSPLRPLDPYRFERQTAEERPYPVSGEYFTGPWGPLTPALNMTVGRLLKPQREMHEEATAQGLAAYQSVGEQGAYLPPGAPPGYSGGGQSTSFGPGTNLSGLGRTIGGSIGAGGASFDQTSDYGPDQTAGSYLAASGSIGLGSTMAGRQIGAINQNYMGAADPKTPFSSSGAPRILTNAAPVTDRNLGYQAGELGYRMQEMAGIYGFAFGSIREGIGLGSQDFTPQRPVLESASNAYGIGRSFWDLNLGGLGDANLPTENPLGSLEFSEVVRRFIPKERSGTQTINPIANRMGMENPWLPGSDYFTNFKEGDPYTAVSEGEMRLPGQAYERFHDVKRDSFGAYSAVDQHRILGDVAPWSNEYNILDRTIDSMADSGDMEDVEETRYQVGEMAKEHNFTSYKYKYSSPWEQDMNAGQFMIGRALEDISHRDTILNTKLLHKRTAVEDWERDYVYGSNFPQWQSPIEDFVEPAFNRSTQRNPGEAAAYMGIIGSLFGRSAQAKAITSVGGAAFGLTAGVFGQAHESITGERYLPEEYKEKMAVEEYSDILTYVKYKRLESQAQAVDDMNMAKTYADMAGKTMYGVNLNAPDISGYINAIPKQKREHFESMLMAPEQERERVLSTAPRLQRRMLQAAWGQPVEELPDLDEYFDERELPGEEWEGWDPRVGQDAIKIKIAQSMGMDLSEMGYYPQQIREANLLNPSYPSMHQPSAGSTVQRMLRAVFRGGGTADVTPSYTPFSGDRLNIREGVGV